MTSQPSLRKNGSRPNNAKLLGKLVQHLESGAPIDLWLPFPQQSCTFCFGPDRRPVPIGTLALLWSAGSPYRQPCPECGTDAYAVAFGGLLAIGGIVLLCPSCKAEWIHPAQGMVAVSRMLRESPIAGTPFAQTGGLFGGAIGSDGSGLRAFFGVQDDPDPEEGVSMTLESGATLSIPLEADLRTRREEPPHGGSAPNREETIVVVAAPGAARSIGAPRHKEADRPGFHENARACRGRRPRSERPARRQ